MDQARKQSHAEADRADARVHRIWRFLGVCSAGLFALVIALTLLQCSISKPGARNTAAQHPGLTVAPSAPGTAN